MYIHSRSIPIELLFARYSPYWKKKTGQKISGIIPPPPSPCCHCYRTWLFLGQLNAGHPRHWGQPIATYAKTLTLSAQHRQSRSTHYLRPYSTLWPGSHKCRSRLLKYNYHDHISKRPGGFSFQHAIRSNMNLIITILKRLARTPANRLTNMSGKS